MISFDESARVAMERCDILGGYSEESDRLTRRYGTVPMRQANEAVGGWMRAAGMDVHTDAVGNLIGRYEADTPGALTLLLGSHLDTVRDAGKYDGPLGVMVALACVELLHARGERLSFAIEVVGFADEEGLRYHTAYLGSTVFVGTFNPDTLKQTDGDEMPLADTIRAFGGDPNALAASARRKDDLIGYCEVHIEQGPVLEAQGLPVGVVSAIQGQTRVALTFSGVAGHAGTVPMTLRRDALCAASEFVLAVESYARETPGLVATVGELEVDPGASNVIAGRATLSLDVRHANDMLRVQAVRHLNKRAKTLAQARGVAVAWLPVSENRSVPCAPGLTKTLAGAVQDAGYPMLWQASGAGHDAVPMSQIADVAMLFVRCKGGVSHSPAESVAPEDVAVAIEVLERFLQRLASRGGGV
ncbi:MAG TPA: allantoate amidohydrolase [Ktedonobacterales bacterium]|jgi:allantoate deiminase|nr:allantoate amidohydrolase [Ktedonobacterales bacterium]